MALNGIWIDPSDDNVVTVDGSPENVVTAITDKSVSGNDVTAANPTFLANFEGADGIASPPGYTSQDLGARVPTFLANAQLDTAQKKFGNASLLCDGTGDVMEFPDSADWDFGTGDFTIELWVRFNSTAGEQTLIGNWANASTGWRVMRRTDTGNWEWREPGNTSELTYSNTPSTATWIHFALTRKEGELAMFLDGVKVANKTSTNNITGSSQQLQLGGNSTAATQYLNGWLDDVRIVKGTALYTRDFTPPTRAHPMPPASAFDAQPQRLLEFDDLSSVRVAKPEITLLANFDGVDGSAGSPEYISEDAGARLATFASTAQLDTAQFKFGTSSALFTRASSDYITFPASTDWDLGGDDFTVEMWVRFASVGATEIHYLCGNYDASTSPEQRGWACRWSGFTNELSFIYSTDGQNLFTLLSGSPEGTFTPSTGVWYHIAFSRNNDVLRSYVDGVETQSSAITDTIYHPATTVFDIGAVNGAAGYVNHFNGWMDDLRVIRGRGMYPKEFTPPTQAHETQAGDTNGPDFELVTVITNAGRNIADLLLEFDQPSPNNTYTSDDLVGRTVTFNSLAFMDTAQFRFGSASLRAGLDSASAVSIPQSSPDDLAIGSQDFTIDFWVRPNTTSGTDILYDQRLTASDLSPAIYLANGTLHYYMAAANRITGPTLSSGTWYHISLVRKDGVSRMYVDGAQVGSDYADTNVMIGNPIIIGGTQSGPGFVNAADAWIDSVRVIIGDAVYPNELVMGVTGDASPLDETGWRITRPSMNTIEFSVGDEDTNVVTLDVPLNNNPVVVSMTYDSVAGYLEGRINGASFPAIAYTGTPGFAHDFAMGPSYTDIYEVVYVDRTLLSDDRQRAEGYLANKWNIASILPVGHPFRDQAPDIVEDAELVANFNGADGATSYTAETGQVATFVANAQLDNAQQKFGELESPLGTSALFDGALDCVTFPDSADWDFGSGDFTVEFWVRFNGVPTGSMWLIGSYNSTGSQRSWGVRLNFTPSPQQLQVLYSTDGTAGNTTTVGDPWLPASATWYHIAVSRIGGDLRIFIDGVLNTLADVGVATSLHNSTEELRIGGVDFGSGITEVVDGWIDSVRIIKGTALYQNDFTPPLREFQIPVPAALIANFNGLDGITSPPGYVSEDASARVPVFRGTAQLDTAQKKFGGSSLLLDGNSDWVEFPDDPEWDLAGEDFTVECWIRPASISANLAFVAHYNSITLSELSWLFDWIQSTAILTLGYSTNGSAYLQVDSATWTPTINTWHHMCMMRSNDRLYMYADGLELLNTSFTATLFSINEPLDIGVVHGGSGPTNHFDGHIDGVRVVKGTALYIDQVTGSPRAFPVPIAPPGEPIV